MTLSKKNIFVQKNEQNKLPSVHLKFFFPRVFCPIFNSWQIINYERREGFAALEISLAKWRGSFRAWIRLEKGSMKFKPRRGIHQLIILLIKTVCL